MEGLCVLILEGADGPGGVRGADLLLDLTIGSNQPRLYLPSHSTKPARRGLSRGRAGSIKLDGVGEKVQTRDSPGPTVLGMRPSCGLLSAVVPAFIVCCCP